VGWVLETTRPGVVVEVEADLRHATIGIHPPRRQHVPVPRLEPMEALLLAVVLAGAARQMLGEYEPRRLQRIEALMNECGVGLVSDPDEIRAEVAVPS
jgi:hypothetical protein